MKIIFTGHSKQRILERGILKSEIEKAVENPTSVLLSYGLTERIQKIIKGRTLEIVLERNGQIITIITAYYL